MNITFTIDEIRDAARTARVYCPGFTEDMFESLMQLEKRLEESGYLETVIGLIRLEEERGISCSEALDACKELVERKTKLEGEVSKLTKRAEIITSRIKEVTIEDERVKKELAKASQALAQTKSECAAAERELDAIYRKTEMEDRRLEEELEDCRRQIIITKEEVVSAGKTKAEIESHGFTLEMALGLAGEFAGYENAGERLAAGLEQHGSLTKYLADLSDKASKEKTMLAEEIAGLEARKTGLTYETSAIKNTLAQLTADTVYQESLRTFYARYAGVSALLEHLASWNEIFFMRCTHPVFEVTGAFHSNSGNARFWTDKPPVMCPQCGYNRLAYDDRIYRDLNWPVGQPGRLRMGE